MAGPLSGWSRVWRLFSFESSRERRACSFRGRVSGTTRVDPFRSNRGPGVHGGHVMRISRVPPAAWLPLLAVLVAFPLQAGAQNWTDTGGGDHGGQDWQPADGAAIAGVHTNIGTFRVAAGTTVNVAPWDGTQFGEVEILAEVIAIEGTLSANGAGYGGGAGGSNDSCCASGQTGANPGTGGGGGAGGTGHWGCGGT